ncbi:MAG: hypothetical protein Q9227_006266 [Pyrenula ochraceoflavens]
MPASSLFDMAQRAAIRYCRDIYDVGATPVRLIKPIISKIENPMQLKIIEEKNPELIEENKEKWLEFIKRDIQDWEQRFQEPPEGESWWYSYVEMKQQAEEDAARGAESLKAALNAFSAVRKENVAEIHRGRADPAVRRTKIAKPAPSGWRKGPTFNIKKMKTPNHKLVGKSSAVVQAPPGFVDQFKRQQATKQARMNPVEPTSINSGNKQHHGTASLSANDSSLAGKESRLRAIMSGNGRESTPQTATKHSLIPPKTHVRPPTQHFSSTAPSPITSNSPLARESSPSRQALPSALSKRSRIEKSTDSRPDRKKITALSLNSGIASTTNSRPKPSPTAFSPPRRKRPLAA